jgi:hypothetical protein
VAVKRSPLRAGPNGLHTDEPLENNPVGVQKRILLAAICLPLLFATEIVLQVLLDKGVDWIFANWITSFAAPPLNLIAVVLALVFLVKHPKELWPYATAAMVLNIGSAVWWVSLNIGIRIGSGV